MEFEMEIEDGRSYICASHTSGAEYPAKNAREAGIALEKYLADYCGMEAPKRGEMQESEKVELLAYLLEKAIRELKLKTGGISTAKVLDLIGTNSEEMKKLGFHTIP